MKIISRKYFCRTIPFIGLLFFVLQLDAQVVTVVKGRVTTSKGETLPGVMVVEKNKDNRQINGTITSLNGDYQLKISDKSNSLFFSFIGMTPVVKAIKGQTIINVTMEEAVTELAGVVITGIAAKSKVDAGGFLSIAQRDQTAAVSSINMKDLEEIPATSIDQVLQGQVSGLLISMNSGDPGSGSSIQIRGAASLGLGSKPLIVVDNVPFKTNQTVDLNNPEGLSELVSISPSDIDKIDVLKDAAATALYGSDGANGVIVITTKRGDKVKPRINITSTTTLKYPQHPLPLLNGNQYKTMILEGYQNRYGTDLDLTSSPIGKLFLEPTNQDYENYNNNTYWPDKVNMIRGFGQNITGSIIGGGEATKYNVSLGYLNDVGPAMGTKFSRVTGRFNFDYTISDKLLFVSDISFSSETKTSTYENTTNLSLIKAPVLPVFTEDNFGKPLSTFFFPGTTGFQNDIKNPVALIHNALSDNGGNRIDSKVSVRYTPFKGVQINSLVSTTYEALTTDKFLPHSATGYDYYRINNIQLYINNQVNNGSVLPKNAFSIYNRNDITYTLNKNKHTLQALVNTTYTDERTRLINLVGYNTPSEYLKSPGQTDMLNTISSATTILRTISLIGQAYYLYGDRYALSGSIRQQGSSAFGKNNRFGTFPAISGFWRPSSEPFLKERFRWIDQLKFRGSWGITGRPPSTSSASYLTYSSNSNLSFIDLQGITTDNIQLANLRWEKTTQANVGADLSLFKGRLSFVADLSRSMTRDLLTDVPVSPTSGYETIYQNFGDMKVNVLEGAVTGMPILKDKFEMTASFNISSINTKVVSLPNHEPVVKAGVLDNGKYMNLVNEGDATGTLYGLKYLGVYSRNEDAYATDTNGNFILDLNNAKVPIRWATTTGTIFTGGDSKYEDINHDGLITKQDVVAIGNAIPQFYGGFMLRMKYNKQWELFTNFLFQYKFDLVNMAKMNTTNMYTNNNQTQAVMRRWRKQGDVTDIPRALYGTGYNWAGSDRYVEDGSYIKCSTITLSYNLNKWMLDKIKFRSAKLAVTVYNAFILTKYSGVDPSVSSNNNDPFYVGYDYGLTPTPITYTLGIWLNF